MKAFQTIKKAGILSLLFLNTVAYGTTFKSVASGDWSSTATWGGTAPSFSNTGDDIVIASGTTVTMDNNVTLNGLLSTLEVEGTLTGSSSTYLTVTTGTLSGAGNIATGWVTFGTATVLSFTGSVSADYYSNSATLTLKSNANLVVNKAMTLMAGILSIESQGSLSLNSNASFVMSGGTIVTNGGKLTLSSSYNVTYTSSTMAGAELTGKGLNNVTVDVSSGSSVTLNNNLNVDTLTLTSGTLVLNGNNLTINGNFQSSAGASLSSTSSSDIVIKSSSAPTGYIAFASNGNSVNNLTVNITDGGTVKFDTANASITVAGKLTMTNGNINIGNNTLTISSTGSISGASGSSYIITGTSGYLAMSLTAGASTGSSYPIGTSTNYFPAVALLNSGSANGMIMVNVKNNVYSHGSAGTMLSTTQPMVNATWDFASNISSSMNMNMTLMWQSSAEVNAFDRTKAYISHYTNSQWDLAATASATAEAGGTYGISRNNITSFSPFAVFDQETASIDQTTSIGNDNFNLYPDPAFDNIYVTGKSMQTGSTNYAEIISMNGKVVGSFILNANSPAINISYLPAGCYYIKLTNQSSNSIQKFIKM